MPLHCMHHLLYNLQEATDYKFVYSVKAPYHGDDHSHQVGANLLLAGVVKLVLLDVVALPIKILF